MKFAHPFFFEPIIFPENKINVLIMENPILYRSSLLMIKKQCEGEDGEFVLSTDKDILPFSKTVEYISDPFSLDFSSKKLMTKLLAEMQKNADEQTGLQAISQLNELGFDLISKTDAALTFSPLTEISPIIKLLNFQVAVEDLTFPEQILEYIRLCRRYLDKKLFIIPGLHTCLSETELVSLYKNLIYEKISVLLIEKYQNERIAGYEKGTLIDNDLCEL